MAVWFAVSGVREQGLGVKSEGPACAGLGGFGSSSIIASWMG
jgi:hypothetical protein